MMRFSRGVLLAAMAATANACDDDPTSPAEADDLAGTYAAISVDGGPLPAALEDADGDRIELISGSLTLEDNGTFAAQSNLRITLGGVVTTRTDATDGTWTLNDDTVRFDPNVVNAPDIFMVWDGNDRLSQTFQGHTVIFER